MGTVLLICYVILSIAGFALFVIVLVKLHKEKGILHSVAGFFCGFYPFIWGWISHRRLEITKVMAAWTIIGISSTFLGFYLTKDISKFAEEMATKQVQEQAPIKKANMQNLPGAITKKAISAEDRKKAIEWVAKAQSCWKNGSLSNPEEALHYLDQALSLNPNDVLAYNQRGIVYYEMGMFQKSIEDYNQAIDLDPKCARTYYNMGLVKLQLGETSQMCINFFRACDLGDCDGLNWAREQGYCW